MDGVVCRSVDGRHGLAASPLTLDIVGGMSERKGRGRIWRGRGGRAWHRVCNQVTARAAREEVDAATGSKSARERRSRKRAWAGERGGGAWRGEG